MEVVSISNRNVSQSPTPERLKCKSEFYLVIIIQCPEPFESVILVSVLSNQILNLHFGPPLIWILIVRYFKKCRHCSFSEVTAKFAVVHVWQTGVAKLWNIKIPPTISAHLGNDVNGVSPFGCPASHQVLNRVWMDDNTGPRLSLIYALADQSIEHS